MAVASETIRRGELVAFPTETVYGLGANALDEKAVWRIFAAKGRVSTNPLIVHVLSAEEAQGVVKDWPEVAQRLADRFWPGPLTMVLPKQDCVPGVVTGGGGTVAVRAPEHPVARALLEASQVPIAAPSANPSNRISATTAQHVAHAMGDRVDLILDGGATTGGLESTVIDLTVSPPRILRWGLVTAEEVEEVLGQTLTRAPLVAKADSVLISPGMLSRHYAPSSPLIVAPDDGRALVDRFLGLGFHVGWMHFETGELDEPLGSRFKKMPSDVRAYSSQLYAELHRMDAAGVDRIVVAAVDAGPKWEAVRDRLMRASTPE